MECRLSSLTIVQYTIAYMASLPLSVTSGIDTGNQILSPFDQPSPLTRSRSQSRNKSPLSRTNGIVSDRPSFGSADSGSSASSSSTTISTRSDTSSGNRGREGSPNTPPSDYGEDVKGLEALSCAVDLRDVPILSLPSRGFNGESPGACDRRRESPRPRPSTPPFGQREEEPGSTRSTSDVTRGLSCVEIHDESPTVGRVQRLNLKKLADAAKAAKAAEEAELISSISEAFGALDLYSESNDTESGQEPKNTDEAVVSSASHGQQLEQQQQTPFDVADYSSLLREDVVSILPNSETAVLLREIDEQSDAATMPTTMSLTPTSILDNTTESYLEDELDATASSDVNRQADLNEGSGSTSVETVTPLWGLQNGESRRPPKVKENAAANEVVAKKAAAKEAREKDAAAKKEARKNKTTSTTATGVDPTPTSETTSVQSLRKRKGAKSKANAPSSLAAEDGSTSASDITPSRSSQKRKGAEQGDSTVPAPNFVDYNKRKFTVGDLRDKILKVIKKYKAKPDEEGYLYIYRSPTCADHVKIGMTTDTSYDRINQWGKCNLPITCVQDDKSVAFLHVRLAETLIKEELHNVRRKYACHKCKRLKSSPLRQGEEENAKMADHGEWYKISEEKALTTVHRWRDLLVNDCPYDEDGCIRPSWKLKLVHISNQIMADEEQFMTALTQPLQAKEKMLHFYKHSDKKLNDEWLKIRTFILYLLEAAKIGVDLSYNVVLLVAAFFIWYWINAGCAGAFLIFSMLAWLCRSFDIQPPNHADHGRRAIL